MPPKTTMRTQPTVINSKKPIKPVSATTKTASKKPVPAPVRSQTQQRTIPPITRSPTKPSPTTTPKAPQVKKSTPKKSINNKNPSRVSATTTSPNRKPATFSTKPVSSAGIKIPHHLNPAVPPKEPINGAGGSNWINRTVQNRIAGVGNYAGGWVNSVGENVNKIGEGIGSRITDISRSWGQGVAGYGNSIKDSVGVGGTRVATGKNPLGIAGNGSG